MNCKTCGACCLYLQIPISELTEDLKKWLLLHENIGITTLTGETNLVIFNKCKNFKDGLCIDYANRPNTCREFKIGDKGCKIARIIMKVNQ